jgi:organic radical activating enzyme
MRPIEIYDKNNVLVINWTLNSLCTYHCTYCPDILHRGTNEIIDKSRDRNILENFLIKLKEEVKDRPVHIFLNGGEPTINPHFEFLCDKFKEYDWYCHVNTNGSRSLAWWLEHAPKLYKITLSYHPEWENKDIFEKMEALGQITNTGVFVLMWPPMWDKCVAAYDKFKTISSMAHVGFTRVFKKDQFEQDTSYEYTTKQLEWFEKETPLSKPFEFKIGDNRGFGSTYMKYQDNSEQRLDDQYLLNNRLNNFFNWTCNIGLDCLYISFFGKITGASCGQGQDLGTLENFRGLAKSPVICKQFWCSCALETNITKKSNKA